MLFEIRGAILNIEILRTLQGGHQPCEMSTLCPLSPFPQGWWQLFLLCFCVVSCLEKAVHGGQLGNTASAPGGGRCVAAPPNSNKQKTPASPRKSRWASVPRGRSAQPLRPKVIAQDPLPSDSPTATGPQKCHCPEKWHGGLQLERLQAGRGPTDLQPRAPRDAHGSL